MKHPILITSSVFMFIIVFCIFANNNKHEELSYILLENVEALTYDEYNVGTYCTSDETFRLTWYNPSTKEERIHIGPNVDLVFTMKYIICYGEGSGIAQGSNEWNVIRLRDDHPDVCKCEY